MTYLPSRLQLPSSTRSVWLRFVPPAYEITLRDEEKICERAIITGAQLRQVALDMTPVECPPIKLSYAARHVLVEISNRLFARVLDVDFMKLHEAASSGAGETVNVADSIDLR